jgi:hypothetical protein
MNKNLEPIVTYNCNTQNLILGFIEVSPKD